MGKAKKGRKGAKGDDSESEMELDNQDLTDQTAIKKGKGAKTKPNDSDEEQPKVSKKSKGKKKGAVSEDSDEAPPPQPAENQGDSDSETKDSKKKTSNISDERTKDQSGKKGKKARRKRNDSDDDDLEKALAELELEYSGKKKEDPVPLPAAEEAPANEKPDKKKNKEKLAEEKEIDETEESGGTVKTAAQKKKEKKEREKQKKQAKKTDVKRQDSQEDAAAPEAKPEDDKTEEDGDGKKKKKKKGAKEEEKDAKKGPGKKTIAAMQEALKKLKEDEEQRQREEEERVRRLEEAEDARLEALRLEQERKDKKKQKEKERKERLKAEGKLLTAKQKADRARAQALIDSLKAQGVELPDVGERKPRLGTRVRPSKQQKDKAKGGEEQERVDEPASAEEKSENVTEEILPAPEGSPEKPESEEDVKDAWDASSGDEESEESPGSDGKTETDPVNHDKKKQVKAKKEENGSEDGSDRSMSSMSSDSDDDSEDDDDDDDDDSEDNDGRTPAEKARDRALERIKVRKEEAEKHRTVDTLRAAIVCVLGHVDTGKTKILDKLRRTNVQDGEAGGITQQIGATNVPIDAIKEQIKIVKGAAEMELRIPGLLIIDTPGHESFSNLRSRGSSLCDIAILVVDIMHGLEPQTIESINLLKTKKTPFIVALNKIDRLFDWQTVSRRDIRDVIKAQSTNTQTEFDRRVKEVVLQFAEQGLNAALFYENPDIRSYVSLIPTSAITGEGMGNLLSLIVEYCQTKLPKRLMYSDELQATVLEVKAIPGLGTTIDVILVNGTLREGDTMLCAGTDGPIVTQIRSLLMPQPLRELRVKNAYVEYKEIRAAQGVKIAAKELEKAIAGLNLLVAHKPDEVEICKEEISKELRSALSNIKLQDRGVYVQASTLGSLEALLEFLRTSKIPVNIAKCDVMNGGSYIPLPKWVENKKAIINVKNLHDNYCFAYSLMCKLHPVEKHPQRVTKYPNALTSFNFDGIEFPVKVTDLKKFERQNPEISVNVYGVDGSKICGPIYFTQEKKNTHVNLLLLQDDDTWHYCFIKDLSRLCSSQLNKSRLKKFICDRCLAYFHELRLLVDHEELCKNFDSVHLKLPEEENKILKFKAFDKKEFIPFVVFADFESLLMPMDTCQPDDSVSYTMNYAKHEPYAVAMQVVCNFDAQYDRFTLFRGKDCVERFLDHLKELCGIVEELLDHNEEMKFPSDLNQSMICHICKKKLDPTKDKIVKDHNHFTGVFRGLCHNYSGIRIGPVVKKDVMKASIMLEHDSQYATILAFDVKIERDAQELADNLGVKIFQADIIYHLFDKFTAYREELRQKKREEFKHVAVFPCKLKILPQFVFNSRDPIVVGVMVEAGIVKEGTPICVPSKDFVDVGIVTSVESNHKSVESARKGMEVCIKIEPIPGEAPKMVGRHFEITDMLVSKISRQSIDACKDYFREDLSKPDWALMVDLKKLFKIM